MDPRRGVVVVWVKCGGGGSYSGVLLHSAAVAV